MDELLAALDTLAGEDLAPLFGPALLERLRLLLVAQNRLAAEVARTVRECEVSGAAEHDGLKTMGSWLRGHGHLSNAHAAGVVRAGRAVAHLPGMAAAFAAWQVTAEQAAVLGQVAEPEHLAAAMEQQVDLGVVDQLLTGVAQGSPHADTARAVQHYLDRLDTDGPEPDPTEGRRLAIVEHADGSISGRFDLDAVGGEKLQAALEVVVQAGRCAGDERTRAQQQADALVQVCDNQLASGQLPIVRTVKPHVALRVDLDDLADPHAAPAVADLGFGATISAARPLGGLRRQRHPDRARSRRAAPGCRPPARAQGPAACGARGGGRRGPFIHRLRRPHALVRRAPPAGVDRRRGDQPGQLGAAVRTALATCVHHGFRVERQPDGRWRTWRPDGTEIRSGPQLWLDAAA